MKSLGNNVEPEDVFTFVFDKVALFPKIKLHKYVDFGYSHWERKFPFVWVRTWYIYE